MTASPLPRQLVTTLLLASIPFSAHLPGFAWQPIRAPETASDALLLADKKNKNREDRPRQSTGSGGGNQLPRLFFPNASSSPTAKGVAEWTSGSVSANPPLVRQRINHLDPDAPIHYQPPTRKERRAALPQAKGGPANNPQSAKTIPARPIFISRTRTL
jgi:hypothetical protein